MSLDEFTSLSESEKHMLMEKAGYVESKASLVFYKVVEYKENELSIWIDYTGDEPKVDSKPSIGETRLHSIPSVKAILLAASGCLDVLEWNPGEEVQVENQSGVNEIVEPVYESLDVEPEAPMKEKQDKVKESEEDEEEEQEDNGVELTWPDDKEVLENILDFLGFKNPKDALFVIDLEASEKGLFLDFREGESSSGSPRGSSYCYDKKIDPHQVPEYQAFRKLQKGQARYDLDEPYKVYLKKGDREIDMALPNKKFNNREQERRDTRERHRPPSSHGLSISYNDDNVEIPDSNVAKMHGKDYPETDGILKAVNSKGWIQRLNVIMVQYPQVILKDNTGLQEYSDIGDMETYGAIAKAIVQRDDGSIFTESGTAHPFNLKPSFYANVCEMAATRALGRALRRAFGITTVAEEMEGKDGD